MRNTPKINVWPTRPKHKNTNSGQMRSGQLRHDRGGGGTFRSESRQSPEKRGQPHNWPKRCALRPPSPPPPPQAFGRRASHDSPKALTCTFQDPGASNTTKIPRKDPQEREERMKIVAGEGKKRAKFCSPQQKIATTIVTKIKIVMIVLQFKK